MAVYGNKIPARLGVGDHHVIGQIETSPNGNTVLRAGATNEPGDSWSQSLHIVLTPEETRELIAELSAITEGAKV